MTEQDGSLLAEFPVNRSYHVYGSFVGQARSIPARLGFYLQDHAPRFIENTGYFLALLLFAAIISLSAKSVRSKYTILFVIGLASHQSRPEVLSSSH